MNEKTLLQVAKLGKTIGLKGYLRLHNLSDFPSQFKKGATFLSGDEILKIKDFDTSKFLVLFENYENVENAKKLTNLILFQSIEKSRQTCKLKKDEFFYFDIIGCELFDDEIRLGKVIDIMQTSAYYLFEIQSDELLIAQKYAKTFFVPYLDKFIVNIDIENKKILCTKEAFYILENS